MDAVEILFLSQLRTFFGCSAKQNNQIEPLKTELLSELLHLSAKHSVTPFIAESLSKQGLLKDGEAAEAYRHLSFLAFVKWQKQEAEFSKITSLFDKHQIPYMPLKGAVLRKLYPEAWMRTSCDIDILIPEEQLKNAEGALVAELGYRVDNRTDHDVMLIAPSGVQFELHFNFTEKQVSVQDVWETAKHKEGSYWYDMSPELFYLHHLAHMAKHFVLGGCGIRALIDLWLMKEHMPCDKELLSEMLVKCELNLFANNMLALVSDWMNGNVLTDTEQCILTFILGGGTYGNLDNRVAVSHSRKKSMFVYVFSRVFPNYKSMVYLYPVLRKHRALMPFCHVHRWIHLLNRKKLKKAEIELKEVHGLEAETLDETSILLKKLGI